METKFIPALGFPFLTPIYDKIVGLFLPEKKLRTKLNLLLDLKPTQTVLDFGAGTGSQSIALKTLFPEVNIIALDIDPVIKEIAIRKFAKSSLKIQFDLYDGETFQYQNNYFDNVMSFLVFHHLNKKQKQIALKEIYRVLKPNGKLVIADFGKPANSLMRLCFFIEQFIDGFESTGDSAKGKIVEYMEQCCFIDVKTHSYINTVGGTIWFYSGCKK